VGAADAFGGLIERHELEHMMAEAYDRARNIGQRLGSSQQDIGGLARSHVLDQQLRSHEGEWANLTRDV
jgi:hypothetical protein